MELTSHLITGAAFDSISTVEVALTTDLLTSTPDHSLTLFVRGFYSLVLLLDSLRFPAADIVDIYSYRWEIELGCREMKHSLLGNRLELSSRTQEMVRHVLWGTLFAYKLIRFQMTPPFFLPYR
nr:transposase [Halomonas titanicae]